MVVASRQGGMIRLGDVARVTDTYEEDERFLRLDGRRAAVVVRREVPAGRGAAQSLFRGPYGCGAGGR